MNIDKIQSQFSEKISGEVSLSQEGVDRFKVFTPFIFNDGDHLCVVLSKENDGWKFTDEGHTFMHLSYALDDKALSQGTRRQIIDSTLYMFSVEDRDGELVLPVHDANYGDSLYSFIQALVKISDVSYLSRERVKSTFMQDFRDYILQQVDEERIDFDWNHQKNDPKALYSVDCRINGLKKPIFVYALNGDSRTKDATISLLQYEKWDIPNKSLAIFEDQESINRKVLARLSDVCERQFSSLLGNTDRISRYLNEAMEQV